MKKKYHKTKSFCFVLRRKRKGFLASALRLAQPLQVIMTKKIPILFILFLSIVSNAQKLENCSECSSVKYSELDIINNELFELQLLRNEIFAKHNYSFKNQRLEDYFSDYNWYKPNYKNPIKEIKLNLTEQHNVDIFKTKEETIKKNRTLLISELEKLKTAINENDVSFINTFLNGVVENDDKSFGTALLNAIETVLNSIDTSNINWHKGQAKFEILIDNGFSISSQGIYIKGNSVTIMVTEPMKHSDLMKNDDAFEYPSEYYSESENTSGAELEFKNGKLILINPIFIG
ncbi:YARHG domain-containing protein [Cellulophaga algicola]|uniref:YARHG domain-containing protein n=1 Tax=Cellulophaga algicola TaxID=59600 RepID=UPI000314DD1F|nr:YARHG domain-containing protein [Cellulophaga algicola]